MNTDYKFCKDCQYFICPEGSGYERCSIAMGKPNLVTGVWYYQFCSVERIGTEGCGEAGVNFKQKESHE